MVALGEFWRPILDRVREVEQGKKNKSGSRSWGEAGGNLVQVVETVEEAAGFLDEKLKIEKGK